MRDKRREIGGRKSEAGHFYRKMIDRKIRSDEESNMRPCQSVPNSARSAFSGRKPPAPSGYCKVQTDATRGKNGDKRVPQVLILALPGRGGAQRTKVLCQQVIRKENDRKKHEAVQITPKGRIPTAILLPFYPRPTRVLPRSYSRSTGLLLASCFTERTENAANWPENEGIAPTTSREEKSPRPNAPAGPHPQATNPHPLPFSRKARGAKRRHRQPNSRKAPTPLPFYRRRGEKKDGQVAIMAKWGDSLTSPVP